MTKKVVKMQLIVAHARCPQCGFERILYFTSGYTYGERVVSTQSGRRCAYVNLLNENIMKELEKYCIELFQERGLVLSKAKLSWTASSIYGITCDAIAGEKIDTVPYTKCPNCLSGKQKEDDRFGEQLMEVEAENVTHYLWDGLSGTERKRLVNSELVRQRYIE